MPPLVAIVGPTTSGKTLLGIELAEEFNGEIVSADSRQVYRGLDIGTAKVAGADRDRIPHHLLDVADPRENYTVAEYQQAALVAIEHIQQRGKLPFLVGGSGLYVRAVTDNLKIPPVPPQAQLRRELASLSLAELIRRLKKVDPVGYKTIDLKNQRRVIRALEVRKVTGRPLSEVQGQGEPCYDVCQIGIRRTPEQLRKAIVESLEKRWRTGLVDEVRVLNEQGVEWERLESFGMAYRRIAEFLQDQLTETDARRLTTEDEFAFAKRQLTWFKKDKRIHWVEAPDESEELISDWLVKRSAELA